MSSGEKTKEVGFTAHGVLVSLLIHCPSQEPIAIKLDQDERIVIIGGSGIETILPSVCPIRPTSTLQDEAPWLMQRVILGEGIGEIWITMVNRSEVWHIYLVEERVKADSSIMNILQLGS